MSWGDSIDTTTVPSTSMITAITTTITMTKVRR